MIIPFANMGTSQGSVEILVDFTSSSTHQDSTGSTVYFTSACTPSASSYEWFINGVSEGTSSDLAYTFDDTGFYSVELVANGEYSLLKENYVSIGKLVTTAAEFVAINSDKDGEYLVANDIDMDGTSFSKLTSFAGTIDGANHTIDNLSIVGTEASLVYSIDGSMTLKNLRFTNFFSSGTGCSTLVGYIDYSAEINIYNCYVQGNQTADYGTCSGILGGARTGCAGLIDSCMTDLTVYDLGDSYSGAIVGKISSSLISFTNCGIGGRAQQSGNAYGGAVGYSSISLSHIQGCYTNLDASSEQVAWYSSPSGAQNCYYNSSHLASGDTCSFGALNDTAMKTESSYSGWDFTNTWSINPLYNDGYPYLQCMADVFEV